jgi:YggT family protein
VRLALTILQGTVSAFLSAVQLCMLIRAVLSWFPIQRDHPILRFVCMVTEPLVAPIRALFDRMGWFRNFPIDLSFLVAFLLLSFVSGALGATL